MDKNNKTLKLTLTAVMIALSTALSFVKIFSLPLGGSITLLSMLPVCLISIMYGTRYAVIPCCIYGLIQMFTGGIFGWGLTKEILIGSIFFDYILAFGSLSLAGILKNKGIKGIYFGICLAMVIRFIFHFLSGIIFFRCFDYFGGNTYIYSLCYNGGFMFPEMLLTVVASFVIFRMKSMRDLILK